MKKVLCAILLLGTLAGCEPAIISAVIRDSNHETPSMETRCEPVDMRDGSELKQVLSRYDGWRMIYVSEFTTGNRIGTSGVVCLERPMK